MDGGCDEYVRDLGGANALANRIWPQLQHMCHLDMPIPETRLKNLPPVSLLQLRQVTAAIERWR